MSPAVFNASWFLPLRAKDARPVGLSPLLEKEVEEVDAALT